MSTGGTPRGGRNPDADFRLVSGGTNGGAYGSLKYASGGGGGGGGRSKEGG
jgi:hypothetical protein